MDASPALVEAAAQRGAGRFFTASYAEMASVPGLYDVVVFNFSLLEEEIVGVLRAAVSKLAGGGVIVIQTLHPATAAGGVYVNGWRTETFCSLNSGEWRPMPWYFRTFEGWMHVFRDAGLVVEGLMEPRDRKTDQVLSVLFELRPLR
jgi:hypothetical protein